MTSGACVTKQTVPASTKWLLTWWKSEDGCCCIFKCCTVVTLTRIIYFSRMPKSLTWKSRACSDLQKRCQIIKLGLSVFTRRVFAGFLSSNFFGNYNCVLTESIAEIVAVRRAMKHEQSKNRTGSKHVCQNYVEEQTKAKGKCVKLSVIFSFRWFKPSDFCFGGQTCGKKT